jgi:hypothetical protein
LIYLRGYHSGNSVKSNFEVIVSNHEVRKLALLSRIVAFPQSLKINASVEPQVKAWPIHFTFCRNPYSLYDSFIRGSMNMNYSPFAETRHRKRSKPRVATADSKEWTKRAASSVY